MRERRQRRRVLDGCGEHLPGRPGHHHRQRSPATALQRTRDQALGERRRHPGKLLRPGPIEREHPRRNVRPERGELRDVPPPREMRLGGVGRLGHPAQVHPHRRERQRRRGCRKRLDHDGIEPRGLDLAHRARLDGALVERMERRRGHLGQPPQQRERPPACRVAPLAPGLRRRRRRLGLGLGEHHGNRRLAGTDAVDAPEALDHRIHSAQIHHGVIGIEIDADLPGRCGDQICGGRFARAIALGVKAPPHRRCRERGPLACAQRPREQRDAFRPVRAEPAHEPRRDARCVRHALDEHRDRAGAVRERRVAHRGDAILAPRHRLEPRGLACVRPAPQRLAREVGAREAEHRAGRGPGRRQRDRAKRPAALEPRNRAEQRPHRRREMRLIEHYRRVVPEQPRVQRAAPPPVAVAREQEPRADHVHRPHDDRGTRRVAAPRPVVGEPAAQHPECDRALGGEGCARVERAHERGQLRDPVDPRLDCRGRLVHDCAPIDDVHDAPGELGVAKPRKHKDQHRDRLAEPGGKVDRVGDVAADERRVEPALPRPGVVSDDRAKVRDRREIALGLLAHAAISRDMAVRAAGDVPIVRDALTGVRFAPPVRLVSGLPLARPPAMLPISAGSPSRPTRAPERVRGATACGSATRARSRQAAARAPSFSRPVRAALPCARGACACVRAAGACAERRAREVRGGEPITAPAAILGGRERQSAQVRTVLESSHRAEQRIHRGRQVRLVEHHDRIVTEQPRVHRALRALGAVARERQPRADHVDGSNDHRGTCGVRPPRAIVGQPAAQHPERDGTLGGERGARIDRPRKRRPRRDTRDPPTHRIGALVHERAAVDDVDDARRQGSNCAPARAVPVARTTTCRGRWGAATASGTSPPPSAA